MKKALWILPGTGVLLLDQAVKLIADGKNHILIPGVLALTSIHNTGAAMGIMHGNTALVLILSLLIIAAGIWMLREMRPGAWAVVSLSLIAGGAAGNILDRVMLGYVRDMFEVLFIDFYVFNIADAGVVCGTALCAFSLLFRPQDWSKK